LALVFYSGLRLRVHLWQHLPTQHGADESVSVDLLIMNTDTKNAVGISGIAFSGIAFEDIVFSETGFWLLVVDVIIL